MVKVDFKTKEDFDIAEKQIWKEFKEEAKAVGYTIEVNPETGEEEIIGKNLATGLDEPSKTRITRFAIPQVILDDDEKEIGKDYSMYIKPEKEAALKKFVEDENKKPEKAILVEEK